MATDLVAMLAAAEPAPREIDVVRMRRERRSRLQSAMDAQDVDAVVALHEPHVSYATGSRVRGVDVTHAVFRRPVAVVVRGDDRVHLLGADNDGDGIDDPEVVAHPATWPELDESMGALAGVVHEVCGGVDGRRVAVDEQTGAMLRADLFAGAEIADAGMVFAAAKITKTADELACIAEAQRRNEAAMVETEVALAPGATRSEVAGVFLRRLREEGVEANQIDPIFEPMARRVADGPRTTTGAVAFPTGVGDPTFAEGDLVWVDTGVDHLGYASDFGRTWIVGRDPDGSEQRLFSRWCDVMAAVLDALGPGVTAGELVRVAEAANGGVRPWLPHFYLAHGVGIESAEMPLVGTDLGEAFDDGFALAPGMVLVLEPVVWEDGVAGHRAEEIVAVTETGWCHLGSNPGYGAFG